MKEFPLLLVTLGSRSESCLSWRSHSDSELKHQTRASVYIRRRVATGPTARFGVLVDVADSESGEIDNITFLPLTYFFFTQVLGQSIPFAWPARHG